MRGGQRLEEMTGVVFVYGSLMSEEVVEVLLKRQPDRRPATLRGYKRHRILKRVYPALTPSGPSDEVRGWVMSGLNGREMHILDEYEDVDYYRITERPFFEDGTDTAAEVYVWVPEKQHLLHGEWDHQEFREMHLPPYLQMSAEFLEEYERTAGRAAEAAANGAKPVG